MKMNKEGAVGPGELYCFLASGSAALLGSGMWRVSGCHFVGVMRWVLDVEQKLEQPEAELLEEATLGVGVLWEFPVGSGSGCVQPRSRREHCVSHCALGLSAASPGRGSSPWSLCY